MIKLSSCAPAGRSAALAACIAGACLFLPQSGSADANSPFAPLSGAWRGDGTATGSNGKSERISCKATNTVSYDKINLSQSLVCASDSYRFDIRTNIFTDGQTIRGTWEEATRSETGNLSGSVSDGSIDGTVTAPGFSATISIKTTGDKEQVTIVPQGTDIARVDIALTRHS